MITGKNKIAKESITQCAHITEEKKERDRERERERNIKLTLRPITEIKKKT